MRKWAVLGLILFPLALGVVAGIRLSKESLAVVVGVMLGFGASLPLYFLTFFLLRKVWKMEEKVQQTSFTNPPVIVVNPGGAQYLPPTIQSLEGWESGEVRSFKVIGED
ncbi:MAG: hypothetical protein RMK30_06245 [Anaerolineae bacterium]|nr:hypothetical protein [Anaerolineae bacterium]MDW8102459.1 hypothetical protein [Anaerolineae bacterium]